MLRDLFARRREAPPAAAGLDPAERVTAGLAPPAPVATVPGGAIAGYRILGKLGEGGMGVVYEAEQPDPRRPVALKVMRALARTDDQQARLFRREAEALARLRHPGIAAIYEAGRSEDGQDYFAMELVRGVALGDYLRGGGGGPPPLRERLAVFQRACEAVAYAHQNGVIHRDLKPSNILVTAPESGSGGAAQAGVKVLDFGLARIADADPEATAFTAVGQIRGTLGYMSPEQVRGEHEAVDARSDVYSLGVILYELVTERLPYEVHWRRLPEAVRVIAEEPPLAPSRAWRARHGRSSRLPADLETIVLKALEKDPERRYASATALADDVERFLADRPLLARPPSAAYQLRKLVARHRLAFSLLAALVAVALAFGTAMAVQSRRLARERDAAARERETAERVTAFLVELFRISNPGESRGSTVTAREILDRGAERVSAGLGDQPEVQARLLDAMAEVYRSLGLYGRSVELRRQVLEVQRRSLGPDHAQVGITMDFLADGLRYNGQYAEAEGLFLESIAILRRRLGPEHAELARALNNYALLLYDRGQPRPAIPLYRESMAMRRRLLGPEAPEVANSYNNLALALQATGNMAEAETLFGDALELRRKVLGEDHLLTWNSRHNLAGALRAQGRLGEAEELLRPTLAARRRLLGANHPDIVNTLVSLGTVLHESGRREEALPLLREAVEVSRTLAPHPRMARALHALAALRHDMGEVRAAQPLLREALALRQELLGARHREVGHTMAALGLAMTDAGAARAAEPLLREAVALLHERRGQADLQPAVARVALGACLAAQRRFAEAEPLLLGAGEELRTADRGGREAARARARTAAMYAAWGRPQPAPRVQPGSR